VPLLGRGARIRLSAEWGAPFGAEFWVGRPCSVYFGVGAPHSEVGSIRAPLWGWLPDRGAPFGVWLLIRAPRLGASSGWGAPLGERASE